jgi:hypothetical protein
MLSFLSQGSEEALVLFRELSRSPLMFPLFVVILWRASNGSLARAVSPAVGVLALFVFAPAISSLGSAWAALAPANIEALDPHYWSSSLLGHKEDLIQIVELKTPGWRLENFMVSAKTATCAFFIFSILLLRPGAGIFRQALGILGLGLAIPLLTAALVVAYLFGLGPFLDFDSATATEDDLLRKTRITLEFLARTPELAAATAMLLCWFATQLVSYLRYAAVGLSSSVIIVQVICPFLMLGLVILAFWVLSPWQAALFLLFMIIAYPYCLAFTRSDAADKTLVERYSLGIARLFDILSYKGGYP